MILLDTGPIVAAALTRDAHHRTCVDLFTAAHLAGDRLLVPAPIATLDRRHFSVVRPRHITAFTLLPS